MVASKVLYENYQVILLYCLRIASPWRDQARVKRGEKGGIYEAERGGCRKARALREAENVNPGRGLIVQIAPPGVAGPANPFTITRDFVAVPAEVVIEEARKLRTHTPTDVGAIHH
jgi:hypothetical protein